MKTKISLLLFTILFALTPIKSWAAEAYAVLYNYTLTFYYDNSKGKRTGSKVFTIAKNYNIESLPEWSNWVIKKVVFDPSFFSFLPSSTACWFFRGTDSYIEEISDLKYLNTKNVTNMERMFQGCKKLKAINVSNFDTGNVKSMSFMFCGCTSLKSLDLSSFNTSQATDMRFMFSRCESLTSLDLNQFETTNVTTMEKILL